MRPLMVAGHAVLSWLGGWPVVRVCVAMAAVMCLAGLAAVWLDLRRPRGEQPPAPQAGPATVLHDGVRLSTADEEHWRVIVGALSDRAKARRPR